MNYSYEKSIASLALRGLLKSKLLTASRIAVIGNGGIALEIIHMVSIYMFLMLQQYDIIMIYNV
jgi:hypothetical protein